MDSDFRVVGENAAAPFALTIHRGDGMVLLGMDWKVGQPPDDFAGFAIKYREPGATDFKRVRNRIGFPGQHVPDDGIPTTEAPIQKFRWVHFPYSAALEGQFLYRVIPMLMTTAGTLKAGEAQEAKLALMRETIPGKLNVAFTRGFVSSQAFVRNFAAGGSVITLVPPNADEGLDFVPTHADAEEALAWMGFEARADILSLLKGARLADAEVRVIAYDLNLPDVVASLEALGSRLKIIIDDSDKSDGHGHPSSPESKAAERLRVSAGAANVKRQSMANFQHQKSIAVRGGGIATVLYGSTNLSWRGLFVQSNNALTVHSPSAVEDYFTAFDTYFAIPRGAAKFRTSASAAAWFDLGLEDVDAKVAFSPHSKENGRLAEIGADIDTAQSSVLFSLAFLGQTTKGPIGPALGRALTRPSTHVLGIADARVKAGNLGLTVMTPDNKQRIVRSAALTGDVPPPFLTEPSGLSGVDGKERGTRMHHKFVVLDFDRPTARVYLGSYNFSEPADEDNGENLVVVRDRTVATSYMIEAVRIYDHYVFRVASEKEGTGDPLELKLPPAAGAKAWFERDWSDPVRARDRILFSRAG